MPFFSADVIALAALVAWAALVVQWKYISTLSFYHRNLWLLDNHPSWTSLLSWAMYRLWSHSFAPTAASAGLG